MPVLLQIVNATFTKECTSKCNRPTSPWGTSRENDLCISDQIWQHWSVWFCLWREHLFWPIMFIFGKMICECDYNKGFWSDHWCDLAVKVQGQIYLNSICPMALTQTSLSCFDWGCSYLAHWLPMRYRLQQIFQITDMSLESKVKVKYT